jgi:hypothetical protein
MIATAEVVTEEVDRNLPEGLDFILGHLKEPLWPRTIST